MLRCLYDEASDSNHSCASPAMHLVILCLVMTCVVFISCAVVPVISVDESSIYALQRGIDRICNESYLQDRFLINNEEPSRGSLFISRFNFERPVTLRGVDFKGKIQSETCFVAFITSSELSEVVQDHMERFSVFIAVLPKDSIKSVREFATMLYKCVIYYFYYDPVTLSGAWAVDRHGHSIESIDALQQVGPDERSGWNLRGHKITFLNLDPFRESTHDSEMGQTIAKRHNGSFVVAQSLMQCHDYMYSPMYAASFGSFVTLPEMFQLCFVVPKSALKSIFAILSDPFDVYCWGAFLLTICMVAVLLSLFGESYRQYNVGLVFLELVMHALNGPSHRFYGRFEVRLVGLFMVMNIVLLSCYQSLIISLMSSDRYEPELETMEQINDTCQFQRDVFLQSLGYRFKNTLYTYELYETYEKEWMNKICHMVMCSDLSTGHTLIETQSNSMQDEGGQALNQYFRYSKARLRSSAVMYLIMHYSPMRPLIERYAASYNEGHLHHLPLLKSRKSNSARQNTQSSIADVSMRAKDLMIVWFIFLIGCIISLVVFATELSLIYVPKFCRNLSPKIRNVFAKIKTSFK